jgi:peptidoglycan hydrolase-like protein with peptidoglycan-binding domain
MAITISASVGNDGVNQVDDVKKIQAALNGIESENGGADPKLIVGDSNNPETEAAIRAFQKHHQLTPDDGRVDPIGKTLKWLNALVDQQLFLGQRIPNKEEVDVSGSIDAKILRGTPEFGQLVSNTNPDIVFKDEEGSGADRMMTKDLKAKLDTLATRITETWPDKSLRVTESWDENGEHKGLSLHYEGRAADITVSDKDTMKLGKLAWLAIESGFDWVFFEDPLHVHVSVKKEAV